MMQSKNDKKLNNQGFALVFVITVLSFIAILGVITMSTALLNVKMRGINRDSDKNFYRLETALDEIYAQTGRMSSEILKEKYAEILAGLYKTDPSTREQMTNETANDELKKKYMTELAGKLYLNMAPITDAQKTENCEHAAAAFKTYATSFVTDNLTAGNFTVTVESVTFQEKAAEGEIITDLEDIYSSVSFNGLCLTYLNPTTKIESSLTVDLKIDVPYVRFTSGGSTLLDYVLVANKGITVGTASGRAAVHQFALNGNIYGNSITINNAATVSVDAGLMTVANNLTVNQGTLEIGKSTEAPEADDGAPEETQISAGRNKVWATGIELNSQAVLRASNTDFYVLDDLTLKNNNNTVTLSGGYYGYGNEGMEDKAIKTPDPNYSSAIISNGKKDVLDLKGLDSLMLAGRAYLRFDSSNDAQSVYPLGESLAVKSTQSLYLVPETCMTVKPAGGIEKPAEMNPILFPSGTGAPDSIEITVDTTKSILGNDNGVNEEYRGAKGTYRAAKNSSGEIEVTYNGDGLRQPAFFVVLDEKIYVYFDFESNSARSAYFKKYLETKGDSFEALLEKSGSGVYINENGQLLTSGALYQVTGNRGDDEENKEIFELLRVGQDQVSTSLKWVDLGKQFKTSFDNLKANLAETKKVTGTRETGTGPGKTDLLPMGNYVRFSELEDSGKVERNNLLITEADVMLELSDDISEGLIISGGDVKITGNGTFNGLIMAAGNITIEGNGKVTLNSDASTYEALLEDEEISRYFYDYGDAPSTILNNYEDFVTRENWSRTGLERGGESGD